MTKQNGLPLTQDPSSRLLPWIVGLMMYLASLSFVIGISLHQLTQGWLSSVSSFLTLVLPAEEDDENLSMQRELRVLQLIRSTSGLGAIKTLSFKEAIYGVKIPVFDLSDFKVLPKILEIEIRDKTSFDQNLFKRTLLSISPHSYLEEQREVQNVICRVVQSAQLISFSIVSLIVLGTLAIISLTSRTSVMIHRHVIALLYLVGATESYIARQFQKHALSIGLRGSMISMFLFSGTLLIICTLGSRFLFLDEIPFLFSFLIALLIKGIMIMLMVLSARMTVELSLKKEVFP